MCIVICFVECVCVFYDDWEILGVCFVNIVIYGVCDDVCCFVDVE